MKSGLLVGWRSLLVVSLCRRVTTGAVLRGRYGFPHGATCVLERKSIRVIPKEAEVDQPLLGYRFDFFLPPDLRSQNTPWSALWASQAKKIADRRRQRSNASGSRDRTLPSRFVSPTILSQALTTLCPPSSCYIWVCVPGQEKWLGLLVGTRTFVSSIRKRR